MSENLIMHNESDYRIFRCVQTCGPMTKREIKQITQLSWGSVSMITSRLLEYELIHVCTPPDTDDALGRRPIYYDVNPKRHLMVGVDMSLGHITAHLMDLKGRSILRAHRVCVEQSPLRTGALFLEVLDDVYQHALACMICHISIAMPGFVRTVSGKTHFLHYYMKHLPEDFETQIKQRYGVPVSFFHDTDCMLAHQLQAMTEDVQGETHVLIRWDNGIGMAVSEGNDIRRGAHGFAGELGHTKVQLDGPVCTCGQSGCLECFASMRTIIARIHQERMNVHDLSDDSMNPVAEQITKEHVFEALHAGDVLVDEILRDALNYLCMSIANIVNMLDPAQIMMGGDFRYLPGRYIEYMERIVNQNTWRQNPVELTVVADEHAIAMGAGYCVADHVYKQEYDECQRERTQNQ